MLRKNKRQLDMLDQNKIYLCEVRKQNLLFLVEDIVTNFVMRGQIALDNFFF